MPDISSVGTHGLRSGGGGGALLLLIQVSWTAFSNVTAVGPVNQPRMASLRTPYLLLVSFQSFRYLS